jgi:hypothetical protein
MQTRDGFFTRLKSLLFFFLALQVAVPYDWRLPIPVMQTRDGFFTRLKSLLFFFLPFQVAVPYDWRLPSP